MSGVRLTILLVVVVVVVVKLSSSSWRIGVGRCGYLVSLVSGFVLALGL